LQGKTLEVQIRTHEMHARAEHGVAAHWKYKKGSPSREMAWLSRIIDWEQETSDPAEFMANLKTDLDTDEVVYTWGMPLWHAARRRSHSMAEMLLDRGADPNADVYASGTPMFMAYSGHTDWDLVALLRRHGGRVEPFIAGYYRQTDLARDMLDNADDKQPVAEELLDAAATGGDPEIVGMALAHVDWPRDDPRWFPVLEQPLRIWNHGTAPWARHDWARDTYLTCFFPRARAL
jgi:hypothetical protein